MQWHGAVAETRLVGRPASGTEHPIHHSRYSCPRACVIGNGGLLFGPRKHGNGHSNGNDGIMKPQYDCQDSGSVHAAR